MKREQPVKKGDTKSLTVDSLAPGGKGVAKVDGFPIFIETVAKGDLIEAQIYDVRKSFALAKLESIKDPSPDRTEAVCKVFDRCGGCQWQHIKYDAQLDAKQDIVKQSLDRIGNIASDLVEPTIASRHQIQYRNKAQFPVSHVPATKECAIGYYEKNSHDIVDINTCPVQPSDLDNILEATRQAIKKNKISIYNETKHLGLLRHIVIRKSFFKSECLLTLVLNLRSLDEVDSRLMEKLKKLGDSVRERCPQLVGLSLNFNNKKGNKILSNDTIGLIGQDVIEEVLKSDELDNPKLRDGLAFRLSANSFFQVNTGQAVVLLEEIYKYIREHYSGKNLTIVDAYSGVGTIAMWLSTLAENVYAIEENPYAVADGKTNLLLNDITNVEFVEGKAEDALASLISNGIKPDILILDPPRKGITEPVLKSALSSKAERLIYVSCNPSTLARDLKKLESGCPVEDDGKYSHTGYKTVRVSPIDMFPQTYHVESIAYLERVLHDGTVRNLEKS